MTDAGICIKSVEEVLSFTFVNSPPLGNSLIKGVAIGTSHMAAVTGNIIVNPLPHMLYLEHCITFYK